MWPIFGTVLGVDRTSVTRVTLVGSTPASQQTQLGGSLKDDTWSQVQNVYERRADLIPNLVATVSGAANFEKSTLTQITEARASVGKVTLGPGL